MTCTYMKLFEHWGKALGNGFVCLFVLLSLMKQALLFRPIISWWKNVNDDSMIKIVFIPPNMLTWVSNDDNGEIVAVLPGSTYQKDVQG